MKQEALLRSQVNCRDLFIQSQDRMDEKAYAVVLIIPAGGHFTPRDFDLKPAGDRPGTAPRVVNATRSRAPSNDDFWS